MSTVGITLFSSSFEMSRDERSVSATQIFHYDPDSKVDYNIKIPKPGDLLEVPTQIRTDAVANADLSILYPVSYLYCRHSSFSTLAGMPNKYQWSCTFINEPVDRDIFRKQSDAYTATPIVDLPLTIEHSGEVVTINPDKVANWTWTLGGQIVQPIPFKVNTTTARFTRYIRSQSPGGVNNWDNFQANIQKLSGRVNSVSPPFTGTGLVGGIGCWLFVSAQVSAFRTNWDERGYMAELDFKYRNPDQSNLEGWNKLLRLDGKWDIPVNPNPVSPGETKLYQTADFKYLFDDSSISP